MTGAARLISMLRPAVLAVALLAAAAAPAAADVLKVGDRLAELDSAVDARDKAFKLKAYRDKWVVVTVGASWCKPCAKELPTWDKLAAELAGKVTFIAIDIDEDKATGKKFHQKLKLKNMTLVYMPPNAGAAASYGSDTMPTTFVADGKGIVRLVRKGFEEGDSSGELKKMRDSLAKLVK
jgi:thiol-disulfide isomerase/thioredoxin